MIQGSGVEALNVSGWAKVGIWGFLLTLLEVIKARCFPLILLMCLRASGEDGSCPSRCLLLSPIYGGRRLAIFEMVLYLKH